MALTVATGFVVDDAIVVIENISRYTSKRRKTAGGGAQRRGRNRLPLFSLTFFTDCSATITRCSFYGRYCWSTVPRICGDVGGSDFNLRRRLFDSAPPMMCARMLSQQSLRKQNRFPAPASGCLTA
ncbi:efflux RND transporter permease subunit [Salmonella enterica subsp. enterica]|nr:efflux RND transporter permease subunit [Salmonella enterica subsp. enterica]